MKAWFNEKIFSSNKRTILFVFFSVFFILLAYQGLLFGCGLYFNSNSDDVAQYSPILIQYINYFKEGNFSFYNFSNNLGASIFADVYYVPLDIFSLLIFLLSFLMDATIAFSIVNLSKILFGVLLFAYFLQRKGFKNWIVVLASFMYFSFGGCWAFTVFPTYFSLCFYLPLSLLILDYYNKGKKWVMPLYSFVLVLYNFYNAYTLFWFIVLVFIVVKIRDDYVSLKKLLKDVVVLGLNLALGVLMSLFLFLPSVLYIFNYGSRTGNVFENSFTLENYLRMISKVFIYETGTTTFMMSGGYIKGNFNVYVGTYGLTLLVAMFFIKDRTCKIYKYSLLCVIAMMVIPAFSMLFSGVATAYTRWFNFLNIVLIYMIGYLLNNYNFDNNDNKQMSKSLLCVCFMYVLCFLMYGVWICFGDTNGLVGYGRLLAQFVYFVLFGIPLVLNVVFMLARKKDFVYSTLVVEMIIAICLNFSIPIGGINLSYISINNDLKDIVNNLDVDQNSLERVYVNGGLEVNRSRYMDVLTNENSFHSFFTKYLYGYLELYNKGANGLRQPYSNILNPYISRVIDYKYVLVEKSDNLGKLDFWEKVYEDDNYIVYENVYSEPYYVYENYYLEEEVKHFNQNKDFFSFQKQMFKGVVLEEEKENLNKINYDYVPTEKIDFIKKVPMVKMEDNLYEFDISRFASLNYENKGIYIRTNEDIEVVVKVVDEDGDFQSCREVENIYSCEILETSKKIVINGDVSKLEYSYIVNIDDKNYSLVFAPVSNGEKYFNYYTEGEQPIVLKNKELESKKCFYGMCVVDDFQIDHILLKEERNVFANNGDLYIHYFYDNLEYYLLNSVDTLASNKELTYNKSTINVKYHRESNSDNNQVIVLPITYSEEWSLESDSADYELVRANGGFLGVIVKNDVEDIDVSIRFKPTGIKIGLIGSIFGIITYGAYCTIIYVKRKRENDENI